MVRIFLASTVFMHLCMRICFVFAPKLVCGDVCGWLASRRTFYTIVVVVKLYGFINISITLLKMQLNHTMATTLTHSYIFLNTTKLTKTNT